MEAHTGIYSLTRQVVELWDELLDILQAAGGRGGVRSEPPRGREPALSDAAEEPVWPIKAAHLQCDRVRRERLQSHL